LEFLFLSLGRTARAGKSGSGLLVLAPFESSVMLNQELKDLPLTAADVPILSGPSTSLIVSVFIHVEMMCETVPLLVVESDAKSESQSSSGLGR